MEQSVVLQALSMATDWKLPSIVVTCQLELTWCHRHGVSQQTNFHSITKSHNLSHNPMFNVLQAIFISHTFRTKY